MEASGCLGSSWFLTPINSCENLQPEICCHSTADEFLQRFGIAGALDGDLGACDIQLVDFFGRKCDVDSADVFFEAMQLCRTGDGDDPRFLSQQPRERDLGGRYLFLLREFADHIDHGLIRFAVFRREARDDVAKVGLVELRVCADLAG